MYRRPGVADQVKQFEADTALGRMATVDELVGPAVFPGQRPRWILHRRRPDRGRRLRLLVTALSVKGPAEPGLHSAPKRTRTSTRLSRTRPSTWRVYQFRH